MEVSDDRDLDAKVGKTGRDLGDSGGRILVIDGYPDEL
jgi:hypothetical protein